MSADLIQRLEAVAVRLEKYASILGGEQKSSAAAPAAAAGVSRKVQAYDDYYTASVQPFVEAANKLADTKQFGEWAETAWKHIRTLLVIEGQSKKPSDADLIKFLDPIVQIINKSSNPDNRSPFFNHQKAWGEAVLALSWVTQSLPKPFIQDQVEAADFYLIKVLKESKNKSGDEATAWHGFATHLKGALTELIKFVLANYPTGLEWTPSGKSFADAVSSSSSSSSSAPAPADSGACPPPPPPGPPAPMIFDDAPAAKTEVSGMGAVFGELTKGNVTAGLKKVTKDMMTHKNPSLRATGGVEPVAKSTPAAVTKAPVVAEKKPPKMYEAKGTWFVEHQENADLTVENVQLKENVYILKCKNTTVRINDKCKSISVDNCERLTVVFKSVVSIFECFNSKRVTIEVTDTLPSVSIDKSAGCAIVLSRPAYAAPPQIITSSITELNIVVPGKTDDDDPIEIPLPEQYITVLEPGNKLKTEAVAHSAN